MDFAKSDTVLKPVEHKVECTASTLCLMFVHPDCIVLLLTEVAAHLLLMSDSFLKAQNHLSCESLI